MRCTVPDGRGDALWKDETMIIRATRHEDQADLRHVLDETGLFPSELLADMLGGFLSGRQNADLWLTCEVEAKAVGFCYCGPETLAEGTWNMLGLAVLPHVQGKGFGTALVAGLEAALRNRGQRILIADTSGTAAFAGTRAFYAKAGYTEEARIRDFWAEGDDKVVYWKSLG